MGESCKQCACYRCDICSGVPCHECAGCKDRCAAPGLLEACKNALEDLYNTFPEEGELPLADRRESIRLLEQAIAKAERRVLPYD